MPVKTIATKANTDFIGLGPILWLAGPNPEIAQEPTLGGHGVQDVKVGPDIENVPLGIKPISAKPKRGAGRFPNNSRLQISSLPIPSNPTEFAIIGADAKGPNF